MKNQEKYIDIHSHILPGIDDGSRSMEQTISMLHMAVNENINSIIATPHYEAGGKNPSLEELRDIADQVQEEATKIDKDFTIFLGNEIYYSPSIVEELKSGRALTLAGSRYVLVEFPYKVDFHSMYLGMDKLIQYGYIPILAHMERYYCIRKKQDMANELVMMGCYMQMNTNSVIGGLLDTNASYNRRLINNNLVHFISSDSHNDQIRAPIMQKAIKHLQHKCNHDLLKTILWRNPIKILENRYI